MLLLKVRRSARINKQQLELMEQLRHFKLDLSNAYPSSSKKSSAAFGNRNANAKFLGDFKPFKSELPAFSKFNQKNKSAGA